MPTVEKGLPLEEDYLAGSGCQVSGTRVPNELLTQRLVLRTINALATFVNDPENSPEFVLHAQAYLEQVLENVRPQVDPATFVMYKRFARAHALEACYD